MAPPAVRRRALAATRTSFGCLGSGSARATSSFRSGRRPSMGQAGVPGRPEVLIRRRRRRPMRSGLRTRAHFTTRCRARSRPRTGTGQRRGRPQPRWITAGGAGLAGRPGDISESPAFFGHGASRNSPGGACGCAGWRSVRPGWWWRPRRPPERCGRPAQGVAAAARPGTNSRKRGGRGRGLSRAVSPVMGQLLRPSIGRPTRPGRPVRGPSTGPAATRRRGPGAPGIQSCPGAARTPKPPTAW